MQPIRFRRDRASEASPSPWINPSLAVRHSEIQGMGLFASKLILRNEIVLRLQGMLFSRDDVKKGYARPESLTGYSHDFYLGTPSTQPSGPDESLNHSCDPNLWLANKTTVTARRNILPGEEVTIDYATFEIDESWVLPTQCNCNSHACRQHVSGLDLTRRFLQLRYQGHYLNCLWFRSAVRTFASP